ncbi:hypothetical protein [Azospirillum sp. sgz302134]
MRKLVTLAAEGKFSVIANKVRERFWTEWHSVVLRRDLSQAFEHPKSPVAFSIRLYQPGDAAILFDANSPAEQAERKKLESWEKRGLKRCYVAVLEDGRPIFVQWLCTPSDNKALRAIFKEAPPVVEPGTILLEGAYTPPRFRRLPVMPAAMAQIAEEGRRLGARWAVVPVGDDNASMIKAAQWAGFTPWRLKTVRRRLFHYLVSYSDMPAEPVRCEPMARGQSRQRG